MISNELFFCLCVDDFGITCFGKDNASHLLQAVGKHYNYTSDWNGTNYCGLIFDWHYFDGYIDVSMPGYASKILTQLQCKPYVSPQYSPHAQIHTH